MNGNPPTSILVASHLAENAVKSIANGLGGDPGWIRTSDPQLRRLMLIDYLFAGLEQGTSSIVGEQFPISDVPAQHGVAGMPRLGFDLEC